MNKGLWLTTLLIGIGFTYDIGAEEYSEITIRNKTGQPQHLEIEYTKETPQCKSAMVPLTASGRRSSVSIGRCPPSRVYVYLFKGYDETGAPIRERLNSNGLVRGFFDIHPSR